MWCLGVRRCLPWARAWGEVSPYMLLFTPISTTLHLLASGGGEELTPIYTAIKMELEDRERMGQGNG